MDRIAFSLGERRGDTTGTVSCHIQGQTQHDPADQQYGKAESGKKNGLR